MYGAAVVGRIIHDKARKEHAPLISRPVKQRDAETVRFGQRCFIPFIRGALFLLLVGSCIFSLGSVMCYFAISASDFARVNGKNGTMVTDAEIYEGLRLLRYLGPLVMGAGVFCILAGCVIVFEKRGRVIEEWYRQQTQAQQAKTTQQTYKAFLLRQNSKSAQMKLGLLNIIAPAITLGREEVQKKDAKQRVYSLLSLDLVSVMPVNSHNNQTHGHQDLRHVHEHSEKAECIIPTEQSRTMNSHVVNHSNAGTFV